MSPRYLIPFLLLITVAAAAQDLSADLDWYKGILITKNQDTIYGRLKYDHARKVVVLKDSASLKGYSSRNIEFFRVLDTEFGLVRTYTSVAYLTESGFQTSEFFELVLSGEITVVREGTRGKFNEINYSYFALVQDHLEPFRNFKKRLLPDLVQKQPELRELIKENHLNTKKKLDRLIIVDLYNALSDSSYQRKIGNNYATRRLLIEL